MEGRGGHGRVRVCVYVWALVWAWVSAYDSGWGPDDNLHRDYET